MRKVILLVHASLDGFVGGPNGEMDWIKLPEGLFDDVNHITANADTAIYGRVTYGMMESYWPTAAEQPGATKHDVEHAQWANNATKLVFSKTLQKTNWQNTRIVPGNEAEEIKQLKQQPGKNILMLGSPTLAHSFMKAGLIDEYIVAINPVILGKGLPLFDSINNKVGLSLVRTKIYDPVILMHYAVERP